MCSEAKANYKQGVSSGYVMRQCYCGSVFCLYIYSNLLQINLFYFLYIRLNCFGVYYDMLSTSSSIAFGTL